MNGNSGTDRVRRNTSASVNQEIDEEIRERIAYYSKQPQEAVSARIEQLEKEWDMERILESNASTLALAGAILGFTVNKKWLFLTFGVTSFLLLHGLQGWCPPVPLLRRLGVRTANEIDQERFALKFLRGDFEKARSASGRTSVKALANAVQA